MSENEQRRIFQRNLLALLSSREKTQKEVAEAIGVSPQTFNTWCQGIALPRMGKVQKLADYFGVSKSTLIDEASEETEGYYLNPETARVAQRIFEDKDLRALFDAAEDARPEDLEMAAEMLRRFKATNPEG